MLRYLPVWKKKGHPNIWIQRLKLANFGWHRELDVTFSPRMNLILGPNGSGKSTLFNAMLYFLTGIDRAVGNKADNISLFAGPEERSSIELFFTHGRHRVHGIRSLRPDSFRLETGGEPIRGTTKCLEWLRSELGLQSSQLSDFVFPEQRAIDGFLNLPKTARAAEMAPLFGVTKAETIAAAIQKKLSQVPSPPPQVDEAGLTAEKESHQRRASDLREQLQALPAMDDLKWLVSSLTAEIAAIEAAPGKQQELQQAKTDQAQLQARVVEQEQQVALITTTLEDCLKYLSDFQAAKKAADEVLAAWKNYRLTEQIRKRHAEVRKELWAEFKLRSRIPKRPADYIDPTDADFQAAFLPLRAVRGELEASLGMLRKLKPGQPCPTCGQPPQSIDEQVKRLTASLEKVQQSYQPLRDRMERAQNYDITRAEARRQRREFRKQVFNQRETSKSMTALQQPAVDEKVSQEVADDYVNIEHHKADLQSQRDIQQTQLVERKERLPQLTAQVQLLEKQLAESPQEDIGSRKQDLEQAKASLQRRTSLETDLDQCEREITALATYINASRAVREQYSKVLAAVQKLQTLQRVYHPSEAPRMVIYSRLSAMLPAINQTLSFFQSPYRVSSDEDLMFTAHFDSEIDVPDRRLSVGQRTYMAMAMRVALNSTFASELGVLALDEPTAGLDAQRLESLPSVLEQLRNLSAANSLQVFFVTHDPRVADSFDKVIDLGQLRRN